jgi:hypothetical protein
MFTRLMTSVTNEQLLGRVHTLGRVSESGKAKAKAMLFALSKMMRLDKREYGFGQQMLRRGHAFDYDLFLQELIEDCESGRGYDRLLEVLRGFWTGRELNLIDPSFAAQADESTFNARRAV